MRYRLIATDMDGTLLRNDKSISETSLAAIRELMAAGGYFVISSGRPYPALEDYLSCLKPNAPLITYNGAKIVEPEDGRVLFEENMAAEDIVSLIANGDRRGHTVVIWSQDVLYGNMLDRRMKEYVNHTRIVPQLKPSDEELISRGVTKILFADRKDRINRSLDETPTWGLKDCNYAKSTPEYLEYFSSKVSKAYALEQISKLLSVPREEIIAIGDGYNDLEMIRWAGLGVAMDNAPDEVKRAADYTTLSNMDDGVAQVIRKFMLC